MGLAPGLATGLLQEVGCVRAYKTLRAVVGQLVRVGAEGVGREGVGGEGVGARGCSGCRRGRGSPLRARTPQLSRLATGVAGRFPFSLLIGTSQSAAPAAPLLFVIVFQGV